MANPVTFFVINFLFVIAYVALITAWGINWFLFRTHPKVHLHKYISSTIIVQLLISLVLTIYFGLWMGGHTSYNLDYDFAVVTAILTAVSDGVLFSVLILIAKGYCIVNRSLPTSYKVTLAVWILIFVFLLIITQFYGGGFIFFLLNFIVLAMYLGFIFYIYRTTVFSIRILQFSIEQEHAATPMQNIAPNNNPNPQYPQNIVYPPGTQFVPNTQYPPNAQYPNAQQYPTQYPQGAPQNAVPPYINYPQGTPPNPQNPQGVPQNAPPPYDNNTTSQPAVMQPMAHYSPTLAHANPPPYNPNAASPKDERTGADQTAAPAVAPVVVAVIPAAEYRGGQPQAYYAQAVPGTPVVAAANPEIEIIPDAAEKLKLMMMFHKLMLFFIIATLVLFFLPDFTPNGATVFSYLQLLLVLLFLIGVCFVFRLRATNRYFYLALNDEE